MARRCHLAIVVLALAAARAHADSPPPAATDVLAEKQFQQALQAREHGDVSGACALFSQSLQNNPNAIGTILNVAHCDEEAGRVASAARRYTEARDRAREQNLEEHRAAAEEHLAALAPRVPHLAIAFVAPPLADTTLEVAGVRVEINAAGDVLVDPGIARIVVSAPGRVPFEREMTVAEGAHLAVAVPALGVATAGGHATLGKVLAITGLGLIGTGAVLGIVALRDYNQSFNNTDASDSVGICHAGSPPSCDRNGYSHTQDAMRLGNIATVLAIAGLATTVVGTVLWLRAPSRHGNEGVALVPTLTGDRAGLAAIGRF